MTEATAFHDDDLRREAGTGRLRSSGRDTYDEHTSQDCCCHSRPRYPAEHSPRRPIRPEHLHPCSGTRDRTVPVGYRTG